MAHTVNLIPLHRRRAKARRARTRAWFGIAGGYAVLLIVAGVALMLTAGTARSSMKDLAKAASEIDRSTQKLNAVRAVLAEAQQTLASARAVSDQPDWSILLALMVQSQGEDIVLNRCELTPARDELPPPGPAQQPPPMPGAVQTISLSSKPRSSNRVIMHVGGLGRSQAAVAQFVLQLEATDLFEHVNLLQTSRQEFLGSEVVAFDLDCPLKGQTGGGTP
jgi:hypothetical protein